MRERCPLPAIVVALLGSLSLVAGAAAGAGREPAPAPSPDRVPDLARDLASTLEPRKVRLPDGSDAPVVGSAPGALLTPERLVQCLKTVTEAGAWPAAWLVVQDGSLRFDLVMHLRLAEDGRVADPDVLFTSSRREWNADSMEAAVREATGRKPPRERQRSVVVQSFSTRTETTYVYETPKTGKGAQGLAALLPERSLVREAKNLDLGDGKLHTLALVVVEAQFLPSECASCESRLVGHADTGKILAVLAGEKALEHTVDLTEAYQKSDGRPFLTRYACMPGDETSEFQRRPLQERFRDRELVPLLDLRDLDGDGLAREVTLPLRFESCERRSSLLLSVVPGEGIRVATTGPAGKRPDSP